LSATIRDVVVTAELPFIKGNQLGFKVKDKQLLFEGYPLEETIGV